MDWAVGVILVLLVLDLLGHAISIRMIIPVFHSKPPFHVHSETPDQTAETIVFPTSDGLELRGALFRHAGERPRGLLLFCHELGGDRWLANTYCRGLREAGFDVVAFDFRNHGESDCQPNYTPSHWLTDFEVDDVRAAIRWIRDDSRFQHEPLGIVGISRGGCAAIAAVSQEAESIPIACEGIYSIDSLMRHYFDRWAVVYAPAWLVRVIPAWHTRINLAMSRIVSQRQAGCRYTRLERGLSRLCPESVLVIADGRDTYIHPTVTESLCERMGESCAKLWIVPDAKHNQARRVCPDEYDSRLIRFFSERMSSSVPATLSSADAPPAAP